MALTIDSRSVLRAIVEHPETFPAVVGDVDEFARKVLTKQIKHKGLDLAQARRLSKGVGAAFASVLDSFSPTEVVALLKKMDAHGVEVRSGDPRAVRSALDELVAGQREPAFKPEKGAKAAGKAPASKATPSSKIGNVLESRVHAGTTARKTRPKKTT